MGVNMLDWKLGRLKGGIMKKIILTLLMLMVSTVAYSQCVAEVKNVIQDPKRGSIIVETQYKLNGVVVDVGANPDPDAIGRTRYTEQSGTMQEILQKAKEDIEKHCGNLLIRNAIKVSDLNGEKLKIQKALTLPYVDFLKTNVIGWGKTINEKIIQYKNKEITIQSDGSYIVLDL